MSHFGRFGPPDIRDTYSLLVLNITFHYCSKQFEQKAFEISSYLVGKNTEELHGGALPGAGTSADDLYPLFDRYGKVVDIFIPRDKRTGESRGFAFVRYKYADEAQKAIDRLDGRNVDGRNIMVQFAKYGPNAEKIQRGRITVENSRSVSPLWSRRRYDDDCRDRYYRRSDDYRDRDYRRSDDYRDRDYRRRRSRSRDRYESERYREKSKGYRHYSSSRSRSRSRSRSGSRSRVIDKEKRRSRSRSLESPLPAKSAAPLRLSATQSSPTKSPGTASRSPEARGQSADSRSLSPEARSQRADSHSRSPNVHSRSPRSPR